MMAHACSASGNHADSESFGQKFAEGITSVHRSAVSLRIPTLIVRSSGGACRLATNHAREMVDSCLSQELGWCQLRTEIVDCGSASSGLKEVGDDASRRGRET